MSILDILNNGTLGSVLENFTGKAKSAAGQLQRNAPGGLGGLLGAGALGAVLGNLMSSDVVKGVALAGAGAVAWNFYQKWANQNKQGGEAQNQAAGGWQPGMAGAGGGVDPTAALIIRAITYAARADGQIDQVEKQRMEAIMKNLAPGENTQAFMEQVNVEPIDPSKIAAAVTNADQAEDVYRLSCAIIDIDHFMEKSYTEALSQALGISPERKEEIEREADMARRQLLNTLPA